MNGDGLGADDGLLFDVAEGGDLLLDVAAEGAIGAAEEDVGLDADGEQLLDGVLRGLGLELLRGGDPGDQGDVDEDGVFAAEFLAHLADGFEEGERFDVADGAADFDDGDVGAVGGHLAHGVLDFVGDVGNDLDGFAEVVAAALLEDDLLVDAAGGVVVVAREGRVGEALVVAEVEVGFGAVVGDEDLAVLEGRHGAGIDVEVGVELHQVDAEAAALKQAADGGGRETLAETGHNSARHKDILCRHRCNLIVGLLRLDVPGGHIQVWQRLGVRRKRKFGGADDKWGDVSRNDMNMRVLRLRWRVGAGGTTMLSRNGRR